MKKWGEESSTPILDTYTRITENHPEWPGVRRFILPEAKTIICNAAAPEGKIDMIIHQNIGGCSGGA